MDNMQRMFEAMMSNESSETKGGGGKKKGMDDVVFLLINGETTIREQRVMKFYESLIEAFFGSDVANVIKTKDVNQWFIKNRLINPLSLNTLIKNDTSTETDRLLIYLISEGNNGAMIDSTYMVSNVAVTIKSLIDNSIKIQTTGQELKNRIEKFCFLFGVGDPKSNLNYHDAFVLCTPIHDYSSILVGSSSSRPLMNIGSNDAPVMITRCKFCNRPFDVITVGYHEKNECKDYNITDPTLATTGGGSSLKRVIVLIAIGEEGKERASIFRNAFAMANAMANDDESFVMTSIDVPSMNNWDAMNKYLNQVLKQSILSTIPVSSETKRQAVVFCDQMFIKNGSRLIQFFEPSIKIEAIHYNVLLKPKRSVGKGATGMHQIDYDEQLWRDRLMGKYFGTMFVYVERSSFVMNLLWFINSLKKRYIDANFKEIPGYYVTPFKLSD